MNWKFQRQHLIDAMVKAEGGPDAFLRAVRISIPTCKDFDEAVQIAVNTINHALWDFTYPRINDFIAFLGSRWAPVGAANDPTNLNSNWVRNVQALNGQVR
jgi:hypothetical protein